MHNTLNILQTGVGVVGILGNILIILILSTKQMRNSFNVLLIVLSVFDITFLIITILDYGLARGTTVYEGGGNECLIPALQWPIAYTSEVYAYLFPQFLYPVNNIIYNGSIFLTIVVAAER